MTWDSEGWVALLAWAAAKLAVDFPASFPDEAKARGQLVTWKELVETHPWVTPDAFRRAVHAVRWRHKGPFVPEPAVFLDYLHAAQQELRRETERRLPPPPDPPPPDDPGQRSAKEAARAYLQARGLAKRTPAPTPAGKRGRP